MHVLTVDGLCKQYQGFALKNVSFQVEKGKIMGFIGRNGAGKTTTLKSLFNIVHPDAGSVLFFNEPFCDNELEIKKHIGFVSGGVDYYLKKKLSVITKVTSRFYSNWDDKAYARYMKMFALDEHKTPAELSAGMKVKYSLALALSHHAELLILDEPTSGLDPVSRDDLLDVFLELVREGASILFSTHITSDLEKCADDISYIKDGRILASEDIEAFIARYRVLALQEEQISDTLKSDLIGLKRAKRGYTALISAQDAEKLGIQAEQANLDTIMVHMEKEGEQ